MGAEFTAVMSAKEITLTRLFEGQQLGSAVETALAKHKMERRLRETGERLDLILEVSGVATWEWNVQTGEVTTDRLWGRVLECPREEIGRDIPWWLDVIHPDDESVIRDSIGANLEGRTSSSEFEFRVRSRSGQWKWLLGRGRVMERDAGGKAVRVAGTVLDITDRKEAEAALKKNEELFRTIVATSPVGIMLSRDSVIEWVSEPWLQMFGHENGGECVGRSAKTIFASDEEFDLVARVLYRGLEAGAATSIDARFRRKDGTFFDGHLTMKALDAADLGKGEVSAVSDISDQKRAEQGLHLEKERFENLAHNAPFGMILLGQDGTFEYMNPKFRELFGYDPSEVPTGKHWFRLAYPDPDYRREVIAAWVDDMKQHPTGATRSRTFTVTCKDGSRKIIHFRSVLLSTGKQLMTYEDITERVLADEARMRLATAVEQAAEAIVVTDTDGTIKHVNPAFEAITGYMSQEVVGQNPRILKSGEHGKDFYQDLWGTITTGQSWSGRFVNRRKDGTVYQEDATISPVRDLNGNIINYVAVKRDVTQEVQLEKQLLQAQKMEAVGTLAGGIAHDFNNLLQIVLGFADLLIMEARKAGRGYGELKAISKAARDGSELVRGLLTFSRKAETEPRPVDLNHIVQQAEHLLRRTLPKMISIQINPAENLRPVHADPSQIQQLLLNIAVNARDAMPEGGQLVIRTANVFLDDHYCAAHVGATPGYNVALTISDNGEGMEKEVVEHIYEPFFTTKRPGHGTGLGLAMVYGIVKGHGGHLVCDSEPGVGTQFTILLPAMDVELERDAAESGHMPAFGTETILLVDDEDLIRELGKEFLCRWGYKVLTASDGKEALELYRTHKEPIDLVILDLVMPHMGGSQCLDELLKIDPQTKVLLASGYFDHEGEPTADQTGAAGFVTKPFDAQDLLRMVRKVLDEP